MSRRSATTDLTWLLRWLLVATLVGLGILQGGHCTGEMSAELRVHRDGVSTSLVSDGPVAERAAAILLSDAREPRPSRHDGPNTTAGTCQDLPAIASCSVVSAALPQPNGVRTAGAILCSPPGSDRPLPVVTLVRIGVSRT